MITVSLVEGAQDQEDWRPCGERLSSAFHGPDASSHRAHVPTPSLPPGTVPCPAWVQSAQKPVTLGKWVSRYSQ